VAAAKTACLTTVRHGELSPYRRWKALRHTRSAPHSTAERLGFRLRGTPPQVTISPAALRTASDGRHGEAVRAGRSGQATAEAVQRAASDRPQGGHQTGRASAQAATRRADRASARPDQYEPCPRASCLCFYSADTRRGADDRIYERSVCDSARTVGPINEYCRQGATKALSFVSESEPYRWIMMMRIIATGPL
jgi:hypothetical protein